MYTHFVMLICTVKCCALCITESDLFLVHKNRGFLKTELLWKPNFRDGPEAVRFSQIILYKFKKNILMILYLLSKETWNRNQLWRMTSQGMLEHDGSTAPREQPYRSSSSSLVLDIDDIALQPEKIVPLMLRKPDERRKSTQTWKFTEVMFDATQTWREEKVHTDLEIHSGNVWCYANLTRGENQHRLGNSLR